MTLRTVEQSIRDGLDASVVICDFTNSDDLVALSRVSKAFNAATSEFIRLLATKLNLTPCHDEVEAEYREKFGTEPAATKVSELSRRCFSIHTCLTFSTFGRAKHDQFWNFRRDFGSTQNNELVDMRLSIFYDKLTLKLQACEHSRTHLTDETEVEHQLLVNHTYNFFERFSIKERVAGNVLRTAGAEPTTLRPYFEDLKTRALADPEGAVIFNSFRTVPHRISAGEITAMERFLARDLHPSADQASMPLLPDDLARRSQVNMFTSYFWHASMRTMHWNPMNTRLDTYYRGAYMGLDPRQLLSVPFFIWFRDTCNIPYIPCTDYLEMLSYPANELSRSSNPLYMQLLAIPCFLLALPFVFLNFAFLAINLTSFGINLLLNYTVEPIVTLIRDQLGYSRQVEIRNFPDA
ncbi:MAG: hypothetical protein HYX48_06025 [Chlamydiales bacterium]|nr:hypothetical protein [Chlamydiales bacterium]